MNFEKYIYVNNQTGIILIKEVVNCDDRVYSEEHGEYFNVKLKKFGIYFIYRTIIRDYVLLKLNTSKEKKLKAIIEIENNAIEYLKEIENPKLTIEEEIEKMGFSKSKII
jgi:hypothetical protein